MSDFKCIICGRIFIRRDKVRKGGAGNRKRGVTAVTCCKNCSIKARKKSYFSYKRKKQKHETKT